PVVLAVQGAVRTPSTSWGGSDRGEDNSAEQWGRGGAKPRWANSVCVASKWCKRRVVKFPDAAEFNKRFEQLATAAKAAANEACVECQGCTACSRSTFCRESDHLTGCHYCVR